MKANYLVGKTEQEVLGILWYLTSQVDEFEEDKKQDYRGFDFSFDSFCLGYEDFIKKQKQSLAYPIFNEAILISAGVIPLNKELKRFRRYMIFEDMPILKENKQVDYRQDLFILEDIEQKDSVLFIPLNQFQIDCIDNRSVH